MQKDFPNIIPDAFEPILLFNFCNFTGTFTHLWKGLWNLLCLENTKYRDKNSDLYSIDIFQVKFTH